MEFLKGVHVIETYATTTLVVDDRLVDDERASGRFA